MAKSLTLIHEGTTYTLEYTRKSIEEMERRGFVVSDLSSRPLSTLPEMFYGAFGSKHRGIRRKLVDDIFERIGNRKALLEKLAEMYNEPLEELLDGTNVDPSDEVSWETNF